MLPLLFSLLCCAFILIGTRSDIRRNSVYNPTDAVANSSLFTIPFTLNYPVYRFCTGDVDGDGSMDALVGVIKKTRFHREEGRRIFIFKQVDGKVRPLWLGSRLGAELVDFRFVDGCIRALETDGKGKYAVIDYEWKDFGPAFKRFIVKNTNQKNAIKQFNL
ncbi:hypothetical protein SAMN04487901_11112 [Prevotella communis]|uniref:Repeat domain-containing protein n=1 Tax=Prevotella communis TaxID=2913614 RepID=A0A1G7XM53_9BACT|nr:hypothetical protein SAMN04487901_11112 [Prevotella communis]